MSQLTLYTPETKWCMFKGCNRLASEIVATNATNEHPSLGVYCDFHADQVGDEGWPTRHETCPNCFCVISTWE